MVRGLRGLLWLNTNCQLFAFALCYSWISAGEAALTGKEAAMPQWLLWSCLPGNPGNWQLLPAVQSAVQCDNAGFPELSPSTAPALFCWGELFFPWRLQGEERSCPLKERLPPCLAFSSEWMLSSNLVTDETGTCQTLTSWS